MLAAYKTYFRKESEFILFCSHKTWGTRRWRWCFSIKGWVSVDSLLGFTWQELNTRGIQTSPHDKQMDNLVAFSRVQSACQDVESSLKASCWGIWRYSTPLLRRRPVCCCCIESFTQVHSGRFWTKLVWWGLNATHVHHQSHFWKILQHYKVRPGYVILIWLIGWSAI